MNRRCTLRTALFLAVLAFSAGPRCLLGASAAPAPPPVGKVFLKVDEALELAFPRCEVKRSTVYLSKDQKKRAAERSEVRVDANLLYPYRAHDREGRLVGTAYFETHRVRNKKETLMVVIDPDGKLERIEVCSFEEPLDYLPKGRWYGQFVGKQLTKELALKKDIQPITGATLTARATLECARRTLALHEIVQQDELEKKRKREEERGRIEPAKGKK